ncbi:PREDICTED: uncharacterized protein LOC107168146 [Diuraphis noxia]|uniref:uncharacterized protein LOC107168146 n=1 Tax=Diuraphis noxia TaxID=143948 RepID=UPI00076360F2|nr:PREDICTED: uncharacterized protein LOC107168146 [Diuraphis noxia]
MRFRHNIFCLLSVLSFTRITESSSPSTPNDHPQTTDSDRLVLVNDLTAVKSSDSAVKRISRVLECLTNQLNKGGKTSRIECHDVFSPIWISAIRALFGDENEIGESKKSKKKPWDMQTLMLGAGVKLILFLPVLAILTGKAISLSLTSLLITSLGFLYRNQLESFAKRSDSL